MHAKIEEKCCKIAKYASKNMKRTNFIAVIVAIMMMAEIP